MIGLEPSEFPMLLQELKEIKSGRHERHQFGIVIACAALLVGAFLAWRKGIYPGFFIVAFLCLAPVAVDKVFKTDTAIILLPFQKVWMAIAVVMGSVMSRIILGLFFFGVFTAVRVLNDLFGKPLLDRTWAPGTKSSYWIHRERGAYTPERSEKQY
jgi:hypothetical protein